jgi:hypothetical protein
VAARIGLGEGEGAQVLACGDRLAHGLGALLLEHGGGAVVHAHHHRGRGAGLRDARDHLRGLLQAEALAADRRGRDQPEQARLAQRLDRLSWKACLAVGAQGQWLQRFRFDTGEHVQMIHRFVLMG